MRYEKINPELFIQNRKRFASRIKPNSVAVFHSNDIMPRNADGVHPFFQNTDLFYLSGIDQEETVLLLYPDAPEEKFREVLFILKTSKDIAIWQGPKHTKEAASEISGVKTVLSLEEDPRVFHQCVIDADYLYLNTNEHPRSSSPVETRDQRFIERCRSEYPLHRFERSAPVMRRLRAVKSEIEIGLIKTACKITEDTFRRLLAFIKPAVWEFEIEAEIFREFLRRRSRGPAFDPIIASGDNSCVLHYIRNDKKLKSRDSVLIDFGAEYAGYAADVTRTVPANGRFSKRKKEVYLSVLAVQRAAVEMLRPGISLLEYQDQVGQVMEEELVRLKLLRLKDIKSQDRDRPLYKKYFMHGASHHLGLDVHDVADKYGKLEKGMVLTCEPGIYIPEEGFGVRLENDILVTEDKPVDLTASIPIEPDEIETLMNGS